MQQSEPNFLKNLHTELSDGKAWLGRGIVLAYAALAGLAVVIFTIMSETAFGWFQYIHPQPLGHPHLDASGHGWHCLAHPAICPRCGGLWHPPNHGDA